MLSHKEHIHDTLCSHKCTLDVDVVSYIYNCQTLNPFKLQATMGPQKHKAVTTIAVTSISPIKKRRYTVHDLIEKDCDNELKIAELECEVEAKNSMVEYLQERIEDLKTELTYQRNKREQAEVELDKFYN